MLTMGVMGSSMLGGLIGVTTVIGIGAVVGVAWVGFNVDTGLSGPKTAAT